MDESLKMKRFDHPNVLSLIGVCLDAGPAPYVVMPFMANGSLLQYLKKERPNIFFMDECDEDVVSSFEFLPSSSTPFHLPNWVNLQRNVCTLQPFVYCMVCPG